ncbi:MAG: glycosyltransferase family 4 protein [Chloroflexi bacterium]|nr:glycosyltransferase family 4 protein [Chloroflexota bacterium]
MRIHQLVPSMSPGDATSNHILEIDKRLTEWGFESHIFAHGINHKIEKKIRPLVEIRPLLKQKNDLLIYHYNIFHFSAHLFQTAQCRRILIYHNITPAHFYSEWDKSNANNCRLGRFLLQRLQQCDLAIGDSDFNRQELVEAGFDVGKTAVVPIFLPVDEWNALPIDTTLQKKMRKSKSTNWLTVGRLAPNKALEEIIRLFHVYKNQINSDAHLYLVGSQTIKTYSQEIKNLVNSLDLSSSVTLPGRVSNSQLKTYYQNSDLFISASYHEGFCVPLIESMFFGLPIFARNASAIPETLGHSGILFNQFGYLEAAEMAHLMITDAALRQQIISTQKQRLQAFLPDAAEARLREALQQINVLSTLENT